MVWCTGWYNSVGLARHFTGLRLDCLGHCAAGVEYDLLKFAWSHPTLRILFIPQFVTLTHFSRSVGERNTNIKSWLKTFYWFEFDPAKYVSVLFLTQWKHFTGLNLVQMNVCLVFKKEKKKVWHCICKHSISVSGVRSVPWSSQMRWHSCSTSD